VNQMKWLIDLSRMVSIPVGAVEIPLI